MAQSNPASAQETTPSTLRIIRMVLIGGVLVFGAAFWFLMQQSTAPALDADVLPMARWGVLAVFAIAAIAIFVIQSRWKAADTVEGKRSFNIAGWALAEGMALVGAVYMFLAADPAFFIVGFLAQLFVSFMYLPIPTSDK